MCVICNWLERWSGLLVGFALGCGGAALAALLLNGCAGRELEAAPYPTMTPSPQVRYYDSELRAGVR